LLIIGYTPIELVVVLHINKWLDNASEFNLLSLANGQGTMNYNHINEILEKLTLGKTGKLFTMSKLKETFGKSLYCCTYNMTNCQTEYISAETYPDLPCLVALRMSSNVPFAFDRFKYMDCYYIDGGLADNFPILKGVEIGKSTVGLYINVEEKSLKDEPAEGLFSYIIKLLYTPMLQLTKNRIEAVKDKCTVIPINGYLGNFMQFSLKPKTRLEMFSEGYDSVRKFYN
jgi:hypothetical protein